MKEGNEKELPQKGKNMCMCVFKMLRVNKKKSKQLFTRRLMKINDVISKTLCLGAVRMTRVSTLKEKIFRLTS